MKPSSTARGSTAAGPEGGQRNKEGQVEKSTVEPSTESQVDVANRVQQGLEKANARSADDVDISAGNHGRYDGDPTPHADAEGGVLKPADDTPAVLRKRPGPRQ